MICERQEFSIADSIIAAPNRIFLLLCLLLLRMSLLLGLGFGVDSELDASVASFACTVLDLTGLPRFNFSPEFRNLGQSLLFGR
ncbi:hypothetical protein K438DRAFT_1871887 [Mycena galopus ATCC 62051]|nr:hypothetical protein K438DRAFT_1871887 [Mycena galopus ATCC 62051]